MFLIGARNCNKILFSQFYGYWHLDIYEDIHSYNYARWLFFFIVIHGVINSSGHSSCLLISGVVVRRVLFDE